MAEYESQHVRAADAEIAEAITEVIAEAERTPGEPITYYAYLCDAPGRFNQYPQAANGREVAAFALGMLDGLWNAGDLPADRVSLVVECNPDHLPAITAAAFNAELTIRQPDEDDRAEPPAIAVKISRA